MDIFQRQLHVIDWTRDKYKFEYSNLVKMMNSREPYILFIGAGPSKSIYGDWKELVEYFVNNFSINLNPEEEMNIVEFAPAILEKCQSVDRIRFYNLLRDYFNPIGKIEFKPLHLNLLNLPSHGFITTNIDLCLFIAAIHLQKNRQLNGLHYYPDHLDSSNLKNRYLYHIHGMKENQVRQDTIEDTIFTKSDYDSGYRIVRPFLISAFTEANIIFIGFSLRDPEIKEILKIAKDEQKRLRSLRYERTTRPVDHFIFLHSLYNVNSQMGSITEAERKEDTEDNDFLEKYNLHVIRYKTDDMNMEHNELNNIVNNLFIETFRSSFRST